MARLRKRRALVVLHCYGLFDAVGIQTNNAVEWLQSEPYHFPPKGKFAVCTDCQQLMLGMTAATKW